MKGRNDRVCKNKKLNITILRLPLQRVILLLVGIPNVISIHSDYDCLQYTFMLLLVDPEAVFRNYSR